MENTKKISSLNRFIEAFLYNLKAINFLSEHRLWRFVIIPGIISALLLFGLALFFFTVSYEYLQNWLSSVQFENDALRWLIKGAGVIIRIIFFLFILVICLFFYRNLTLILVTPFLGVLVNKIEKILIGKEKKTTLREEITNLISGLWLSLKLFLLEVSIFLVSLPLGPIQPLLVFFMGSYACGRGIIELMLERNQPDRLRRKNWARSHLPETLGIGVSYYFLLWIPVLGPIIAPATSLVGSFLLYHNK